MLYFLEIVTVIPFAALIFSGVLPTQLAFGIAFIIAGDALLCLVITLTSSYGSTIGIMQDAPSAILALAAASLTAALPLALRPTQGFPTVVMMIVCASLATGIFFILLGQFKLGGLVRYLPYPVLGGFLAGTGWLLLAGGVGVMIDRPLGMILFDRGQLLRWLPGLIYGILIFFLTKRFKNPLALPIAFLAGVAGFYLAAWLNGTSLAQLQAQSWLLGPFTEQAVWMFPLQPDLLSQVNWSALAGQLPNLAALLIVSVIALLLNANSLELVIHRDLDLNHELSAAGFANLAAGLAGGAPGYQAISMSKLNHEMSSGRRLPGIFMAGLLLLTLFIGATYFSYFPKLVLGAMLVFLGFSLLWDWIYQAWYRFTHLDFAIILSILVIIAWKGFLTGIAVGIFLTVVLFVIKYSQVEVVKHASSGTTFRSRVNRQRRQREYLDAHSKEFFILKLQGYIFFGTAHNLYDQIRKHVENSDQGALRWLLLDFSQVSGLDSTGLLSFEKLAQLGAERGFLLGLSGLAPQAAGQFERGGFETQPGVLMYFQDIDHAFEWCENQILADCEPENEAAGLVQQLMAVLPDETGIRQLLGYLERMEIAAGEFLIHQGQDSEWIYFIESGQVTAQLEKPNGEVIRLQTLLGGYTVGELGVILETKRSAAVIADQNSVVYGLSKARLAEIEAKDSLASNFLHHLIARLLSERIIRLTQMVDELQG